MQTISTRIEKILNYSSWSNNRKADALIEIDSTFIYPNLGKDSLKKDRAEAKKNSRKIYTAIKNLGDSIHYDMGNSFLRTMDL